MSLSSGFSRRPSGSGSSSGSWPSPGPMAYEAVLTEAYGVVPVPGPRVSHLGQARGSSCSDTAHGEQGSPVERRRGREAPYPPGLRDPAVRGVCGRMRHSLLPFCLHCGAEKNRRGLERRRADNSTGRTGRPGGRARRKADVPEESLQSRVITFSRRGTAMRRRVAPQKDGGKAGKTFFRRRDRHPPFRRLSR